MQQRTMLMWPFLINNSIDCIQGWVEPKLVKFIKNTFLKMVSLSIQFPQESNTRIVLRENKLYFIGVLEIGQKGLSFSE